MNSSGTLISLKFTSVTSSLRNRPQQVHSRFDWVCLFCQNNWATALSNCFCFWFIHKFSGNVFIKDQAKGICRWKVGDSKNSEASSFSHLCFSRPFSVLQCKQIAYGWKRLPSLTKPCYGPAASTEVYVSIWATMSQETTYIAIGQVFITMCHLWQPNSCPEPRPAYSLWICTEQ